MDGAKFENHVKEETTINEYHHVPTSLPSPTDSVLACKSQTNCPRTSPHCLAIASTSSTLTWSPSPLNSTNTSASSMSPSHSFHPSSKHPCLSSKQPYFYPALKTYLHLVSIYMT